MTKKLLVSCPVSPDGGMHPDLVQWMFHVAASEYPGWDVTLSVCKDRPVVQSRNRLVKQFLETDADVLMTVDSDQVPQIDGDAAGGFKALLSAIERSDVDIVNAITVRRTDNGPLPVLSRMTGEYSAELYQEILDAPIGLHELTPNGVMGGAAIMVKRHVCEKFLAEGVPWFKDVFEWRVGAKRDEFSGKDLFGERYIGHDIWFFQRAYELGFRAWVDTSVFWGHVKPCDLRDEFNREMELRWEATAAQTLPRAMARAMVRNWGNIAYAAPPQFITKMAVEATKVPGDQMVVECGSGLTTTVLQEMLPKGNLMSLEEDVGYFSELTARCNGSLKQAPIESKGEYDWYKFPKPGKPVRLVVCDGPHGDRYGCLPELWEYLTDDFTVLLDDAHRPEEQAVLKRWKDEFDISVEIRDADTLVNDKDEQRTRKYAIVRAAK
jgi:hypothetical protein